MSDDNENEGATIGTGAVDNNTADQLKTIVERVERLHEERKALSDDIADVYSEAKGVGFDVKALKAIIADRRKDPNEIKEFESIKEVYEDALQRAGLAAAK